MTYPHLFTPLQLGTTTLANRVIMAPLTRLRAIEPGDIPNTALATEYYRQRAAAGLIITEATQVSWQAKGYAGAPGLHSDEQEEAWRQIVAAVHNDGGKIAVQLWHTGLVSHASLQPQGKAPISASAVAVDTRTSLRDTAGKVVRAAVTPAREASVSEIKEVIKDYAEAVKRARRAGFDFVEIHGAHGYLLNQFWAASINHRKDIYGGSRDNRARLLVEVIDAAVSAWDQDHIGVRLSPQGSFNGVDCGYEEEDNLWLIGELEKRGLAYLHISEPDWVGGKSFTASFREQIRKTFTGVIITAGAYSGEKAEAAIKAGFADAVAFGRLFISNPDLPARLRTGAPLNVFNPATAYGGGAAGYTDYPFLNNRNQV